MKRLAVLIALATCCGCVTDTYRDVDGNAFSHTRFVTSEKVAAAEMHLPNGAWARLGGLDSQVDPAAAALAQGLAAALSAAAKLFALIP